MISGSDVCVTHIDSHTHTHTCTVDPLLCNHARGRNRENGRSDILTAVCLLDTAACVCVALSMPSFQTAFSTSCNSTYCLTVCVIAAKCAPAGLHWSRLGVRFVNTQAASKLFGHAVKIKMRIDLPAACGLTATHFFSQNEKLASWVFHLSLFSFLA